MIRVQVECKQSLQQIEIKWVEPLYHKRYNPTGPTLIELFLGFWNIKVETDIGIQEPNPYLEAK